MKDVGEMARRKKDINEIRYPVSISLTSAEHELMIATAELCRCPRSTVVRAGVREITERAVAEATVAKREHRKPDFSFVHERDYE